MAAIKAGEVIWYDGEEVLAELRDERDDKAPFIPPPGPVTMDEIEKEALHLPNADFALLIANLEAGLPPETNPTWRAETCRRIACIHAEFAEREREWAEFYRLHPELAEESDDFIA